MKDSPPCGVWILGADDPEMNAIETLLLRHGQAVAYALTSEGKRVTPSSAYRQTFLAPGIEWAGCVIVTVECNPPDLPGCSTITAVDHHRPGDPGYGKPPAEYWPGSSIGQVCALLDGNEGSGLVTADLMMVAAADHCLAAAYAGQCHDVDPAMLAEWRASQVAQFKKIERGEVLRRVAETRSQIAAAPRVECGGAVADLRAATTDDGQILAEAGCQSGIAYLATVTERDGRRKVVLGGAGEGTVPGIAPVKVFLGGYAESQGLTDLYGDPVRGYAGGYEATNSLTATTATTAALAPLSPVTEWHAHLDLQVRSGQMAKDTATTYRQGMRKLTEWASQQESWNRTLILEWVAALKAEGKAVKTVSIWLTGARCFFQWMLSEGRIVADPTAGVRAGSIGTPGGRKRRQQLTESEVIKLKAMLRTGKIIRDAA